jgi:hypothetical protein
LARAVHHEAQNVVNIIFVLLAVSSLSGLALGFYFSWLGIGVSGLVLAFLSAIVLRHEDFGSYAGIAIIVACLTVHQIGCLIGVFGESRIGAFSRGLSTRNRATTATNHIVGK